MQKLCSVEWDIVGPNLIWDGSAHDLFRSVENQNKPVLFSHDSKRAFQKKTVDTM
jgi:hypothetical protein